MNGIVTRSMLVIALLAAAIASGGAFAETGACAAATSGGDWPQHGGEVSGTRSQPAEDALSVDTVGGLAHKWNYTIASTASGESIQTIPIVSDGCVFALTSLGAIVALNADDGSQVWKKQMEAGASMSAPAVHDGVVYIVVPSNQTSSASGKGVHIVALNASDGSLVYDGPTLATETGAAAVAGAMASAVYFDGMIVAGLTNDEMDPTRVGGFVLANASDGSLIKRTYNVPDDEAAAGFAGCSLWSTAAIDPATKMGFVGTGQPAGWFDKESERCDAIIKFDLDRTSPTFGDIVGAAKGVPDDAPYADVDFGSAPTLLRDSDGRQIVAQLQKAGQVTAAFTRHMTLAWRTPVSPIGSAIGNYTASATDGHNVFTVGAYPGQLFSLNSDTGLPNWVVPVTSPIATNSVAYANGVVYYNDEKGTLNAFDSASGVPLYAHPIALDNSACGRNQAGGVSIARHRVYVVCGLVVASYGL